MRKVFIALFFACLMLMATAKRTRKAGRTSPNQETASASTPPAQPQCSFRNLYTFFLRKGGVSFLKEPIYSNKQCRGEWRLYGSCCKDEDVNNYAKNQRALLWKILDQADKLMGTTLQNIRKYLYTFKAYVSGIKSERKLIRKLSTKRRKFMGQKKRKELKSEVVPEIILLKKWMHENKDNIILRQRSCIKKLQTTRINSVCYTCSARAQEFFEKDNIRLHESTCRDIISQCSFSWFYLIEFLDKVNSVYSKVRVLEERTGIRFTASVKGSPARNILKWSETNNFRQNLIDCKDGVCEFDKAKAICDNFVSIRKRIYLVNALTAVRSIGKRGKRIASRVSAKIKDKSTATSSKGKKENRSARGLPAKAKLQNADAHSKGKTDKRSTIEKKQTKATKHRSKGRKLVVGRFTRSAPKATPSLSQSVVSSANAIAEVANNIAAAVQVPNFNPLLCIEGIVCEADKVVMTASQCGSTLYQCTKDTVFFSSGP